jgi:hypothetical protein
MTEPIGKAAEGAGKTAKAAGGAMGKQLGPLPLGAWAMVVGGALFFSFYMSKKKSQTGETDESPTPGALVYTGSGGGGNDGSNAPAVGTTPTGFLTNESWASAAKTFLISQNVDGKEASDAIDLYINAQALNPKQSAWIAIATKQLGPPPQSLPPVTGNPSPGQNDPPNRTSVWGDTPHTGGGMQGMWYTVKAGEKLPDLARRAYGLNASDYSGMELAMSEILDANNDRINNMMSLPTDTPIYFPIITAQEFPGTGSNIFIPNYNPANFTDPNKTSGDPFVDAGYIPRDALKGK